MGTEHKVIRLIILSTLLLSIYGCTTIPPKTEIVYVNKIVSVDIPEPPSIERPQLKIFLLSPEELMDFGAVAQAYKITIKQLEGYAAQLEAIIDGYRKRPDVAPPK